MLSVVLEFGSPCICFEVFFQAIVLNSETPTSFASSDLDLRPSDIIYATLLRSIFRGTVWMVEVSSRSGAWLFSFWFLVLGIYHVKQSRLLVFGVRCVLCFHCLLGRDFH